MTLPPRILAVRDTAGRWHCAACAVTPSRFLAFVGMAPPATHCATCASPFPQPIVSHHVTD